MSIGERKVYDNTIYHIVQSGNNKETIFKEDDDFKKFLSLIQRYMGWYDFELYHYCLMSTHIHLLLKIFEKEVLAKLMQSLFQSFRLYFKAKYGYLGQLYQGRYKSKIINKDEYLLVCSRYIERNPIRAGIVRDPKDYKWSSYKFYAYSGYRNDILTENPLYSTMGADRATCESAFRNYVLTPWPNEEQAP